MKLKPSMRSKKRYLLLENANQEEVKKIILDYLGILGFAKAEPFFLEKNNLVLVVNRNELENVRAAFELSKYNTKVIKVSGTLKGLGIKRNL